MATRLVAKFYNVQVARDPAQVAKELNALLASGPEVLGLCETTGYKLPAVKGYKLFRDTSTRSRANVAAYVRATVKTSSAHWHDCAETWDRTEHPGTHEPRSWLEFRLDGCQVMVGHQPPKGTSNTHAAQAEGIDLGTARMAPWTGTRWDRKPPEEKTTAKARPRLSLADWNRRPTEAGPGPGQLARRIQGWTMGAKIDGAVARGDATPLGTKYVDCPQGVPLKSDHRDALVVRLSVAKKWLAP